MTNKLPNPNNPPSRGLSLSLSLLLLVLIGLHRLTAQENSPADTQQQPLQAVKPDAADPAAAKMAEQALDVLQKARTQIESYDSLKADLLETVLIGARRFQSTGTYLHARGNRVRQEYELTLKGADGKPLKGRLLQVSKAGVMHTSRKIGDQQLLTRRDVDNILAAIEKYPSIDAELLRAELGLGGLPGLLASLERSFDFEEYKLETIQDSRYVMIGGGWNEVYKSRNRPKGTDPNAALPPYVPDYVRVYFDEQSLFPRRIFYFKKVDNKLHPMLTLDFLNVQQNVPLDDSDFDYFPPPGVIPTDETQQKIDQIIQSFQAQQQRDALEQESPQSQPQPGNAPATPGNSGT